MKYKNNKDLYTEKTKKRSSYNDIQLFGFE